MTTTDQATPATVDDLIETMVERITEAMQPIQIRLFGSRARGEAAQRSDVDLLVVLDDTPDRRACQIEIKSLLTDVPIGIDVVVTTPGEIVRRGHVAGTVLNNALEEGKLIYEEEDAHRATALEWLNAAREDVAAADLILAQLDQPPGLAGPVCWHAQQIVEKSLKAVLFLEQIRVPTTHELDKLADLLPERMRHWTEDLDLEWLLNQGFSGRYPDYGSRPSADDARRALHDAHRLYDRVSTEFQQRAVEPQPSDD